MHHTTTGPELRYRLAQIDAHTDAATESSAPPSAVRFVASTETPVPAFFAGYGQLGEVLLHERRAFNSEAKTLLRNHDRDQICGPLESLVLDEKNRRALGVAKFDDTETGRSARTQVASGSLWAASIGYEVAEYLHLPAGETWGRFTGPLMIATRWTAREVSLVPIPADTTAVILRSSGETRTIPVTHKGVASMTTTTIAKTEGETPEARAIGAERERGITIRQLGKIANIPESEIEAAISDGTSEADFRKRAADVHREANKPPGLHVEVTRDGGETFARGAVAAILTRGGIHLADKAEADLAKHHANLTVADIAARCLVEQGIRPPQGRSAIISAALQARRSPRFAARGTIDLNTRANVGMTTSDFSSLLSNALNKSFHAGYSEAAVSYPAWTRKVSIPDFRERKIVKLSELTDPAEVGESAEISQSYVTDDNGESYSLTTFANIVRISRVALINDDLDAMTRIPFKMGAACRRKSQKLVSEILNEGATSAQLMGDSVALFDAAHKNYGTTSTALAIGTLDAAVSAMSDQVGLNGEVIGVEPKFLIVPPKLRMTALQLVNSTAIPLVNLSAGVVNPYSGTLQVVVDPFLSAAAGGSDTAWYLASDPNATDTVEIGFLDGQDAATIEERQEFDVFAMSWRFYIDVAAKAADWRGLVKRSGAS